MFSSPTNNLRLLITSIICTYLCPDKSSIKFPLGMVWIVQDIYDRGTQYTWAPIMLAQFYMYLNNFMCIDKFNITITHVGSLQVWAYDNIVMF